jgi:hypothetical protein
MHRFQGLRLLVSCLRRYARNIPDYEERTEGGCAALHEILLAGPDIHGDVRTGL